MCKGCWQCLITRLDLSQANIFVYYCCMLCITHLWKQRRKHYRQHGGVKWKDCLFWTARHKGSYKSLQRSCMAQEGLKRACHGIAVCHSISACCFCVLCIFGFNGNIYKFLLWIWWEGSGVLAYVISVWGHQYKYCYFLKRLSAKNKQ